MFVLKNKTFQKRRNILFFIHSFISNDEQTVELNSIISIMNKRLDAVYSDREIPPTERGSRHEKEREIVIHNEMSDRQQ